MGQDCSQSNSSWLVISLKERANISKTAPRVNICENPTLGATPYLKELVCFAKLSTSWDENEFHQKMQ